MGGTTTSIVTRWEYRRMWNNLRISIRRPAFIMVQALSIAIILLIFWFLWFFMLYENLGFTTFRNLIYSLLQEAGFFGENAIWLVYALIALIVAHQIIKALVGVPIVGDSEPADVDTLFSAPMKGYVFFTAKYFRTIPRRLLIYFYVIIAILPIVWFFMLDNTYALSFDMVFLIILLVFLLGEIGAVATSGLYFMRKFVSQHRRFRRYYRSVFFVAVTLGTFVLMAPILIFGGVVIYGPLYNLARLFVALVFSGHHFVPVPHVPLFITLYYPALPWVIGGLLFGYVFVLEVAQFLADRITVDLYEEISAVTRRRGLSLGWLSRLPVIFERAKTPLSTVFRKDFVTGFRKPGKAFYLFGLIGNFVFALFLYALQPTLIFPVSLASDLISLANSLYIILLIVMVPLLSINASDPFQGERGTIYLIRLSQVRPFRFTSIKYMQLLLTPFLLAIPVAIYFALFLGNPLLLVTAVAILPHAVLISTAIGLALGSRYPSTPSAKKETPVAIIITYPVISWTVMSPLLFIFLGLAPSSHTWVLLGSLLISPYTLALVLLLLAWSSHSYLRQE
ncbi:MAG: hypothetical protein ACFE8O_02005 [Candidatus Hermodarchaeota archaeon]